MPSTIPLKVTLVADKVTPGTVRFTEPEGEGRERPLSIYLPKVEVEALGLPVEEGISITLTIERA